MELTQADLPIDESKISERLSTKNSEDVILKPACRWRQPRQFPGTDYRISVDHVLDLD